MSHYSGRPNMCRVDFWKESGKWYCTEAVDFQDFYREDLTTDAVIKALNKHLNGRLKGMTATCLEPYHHSSYPISVTIPVNGWKL